MDDATRDADLLRRQSFHEKEREKAARKLETWQRRYELHHKAAEQAKEELAHAS